MRFIAGGVTLATLLSVVGCASPASDQPVQFDPAQGTPTDKVRWSIQFADANGTNSGAAAQDPAGQVRVSKE